MKTTVLCNHITAIPAVEALLKAGILGGVCLPQYEHAATQTLQNLAQMNGIPVLRAAKVDLEENLTRFLNDTGSAVLFVLSFPYKLPGNCLAIPEYGCYNFHPSLLPAYRGPTPLFWQIRNRESMGGISVHKMDKDFDTGPIVFSRSLEILSSDTLGLLENKMTQEYVYAVHEMLKLLQSGNEIGSYAQNEMEASSFARPQLGDLTIDWERQSASEIEALVRACNPEYGGALTYLGGVPLRILEANVKRDTAEKKKAGTILSAGNDRGLLVACYDRSIVGAELIYTHEGYFTGKRLAEVFKIQNGELFTNPSSADS